jgi:hypothetical protein
MKRQKQLNWRFSKSGSKLKSGRWGIRPSIGVWPPLLQDLESSRYIPGAEAAKRSRRAILRGFLTI